MCEPTMCVVVIVSDSYSAPDLLSEVMVCRGVIGPHDVYVAEYFMPWIDIDPTF